MYLSIRLPVYLFTCIPIYPFTEHYPLPYDLRGPSIIIAVNIPSTYPVNANRSIVSVIEHLLDSTRHHPLL